MLPANHGFRLSPQAAAAPAAGWCPSEVDTPNEFSVKGFVACNAGHRAFHPMYQEAKSEFVVLPSGAASDAPGVMDFQSTTAGGTCHPPHHVNATTTAL